MDAIAFATAGPQNFATASESRLSSAFRTFVELRSARKPGRAGTMIASGRADRTADCASLPLSLIHI